MPPRPRGNTPPDPSRPDRLKDDVKSAVLEVLRDPLLYPDEMVTWLASFVSLNSIQSTTA